MLPQNWKSYIMSITNLLLLYQNFLNLKLVSQLISKKMRTTNPPHSSLGRVDIDKIYIYTITAHPFYNCEELMWRSGATCFQRPFVKYPFIVLLKNNSVYLN